MFVWRAYWLRSRPYSTYQQLYIKYNRYLNTFNQYTNNKRLALRCTRLPRTMCAKSWYSAAPGSIPHARRIWAPHAVLDAGISALASTRWQTTHATVHRRSGPRLYQQDWLIQGLWWLISSRNLISVGSVSQNFDCCDISCWTGMPGRSRLVCNSRFSSRCGSLQQYRSSRGCLRSLIWRHSRDIDAR